MNNLDIRNKVIQGDNVEVLKNYPDNTFDAVVTDPPYGISFMGKKWDYDVPSTETWKEVLRVLKPGGHILVACGTRTQHRMAVNIEDAGFEIRDLISWVYGSGFPKSHNVGTSVSKIDAELGETYKGFGTALKPAMELWTLARKPLTESTIAKNVIKHGTGGINIDESRVGTETRTVPIPSNDIREDNTMFGLHPTIQRERVETNLGRFPANFIHDGSDEVLDNFPYTKSGKMGPQHTRTTDGSPNGIYGKFDVNHPLAETIGDEGSAARFFYCAKASKKERNFGVEQGNKHPTIKPIELMSYLVKLITPPNGVVLDPYAGSGSTLIGALLEDIDYFGIEYEEEYVDIINHRLTAWHEKHNKTKE